jgi:TatA/E family protein of Tat protein translocase
MLSATHLIIVFVVVLVLFGPQKLPELARNLGKLMAEFRKASTDFKMAFEEEMRNLERQTREAEWKKAQTAAAVSVDAQPAALPASQNSEAEPSSEAARLPVIAPVAEAVPRSSDDSVPEEPTEPSDPNEDSSKNALHDHQQPA